MGDKTNFLSRGIYLVFGILEIVTIYLMIPGIIYLIFGIKKSSNKMIDLSLKISLYTLLFFGTMGLFFWALEEFFKVYLGEGLSWILAGGSILIIVPTLFVPLIILLIGLFKPKILREI